MLASSSWIRLLAMAILIMPTLVLGGVHDGLVAHWSFDTDFTATNGGSSFDAAPYNGPVIYPGGVFGWSAQFDRSLSQYLEVTTPVIQTDQDYTIAAHYLLGVPDIVGTDRYFVFETYPAYAASYGLREEAGEDVGQVCSDLSPCMYVPGGGDAVWRHVAVTFDADATGDEIAVYLDGILVDTMPSGTPLLSTDGLILGGHRDRTGRNWTGWIDDVGVWDRVLTPEEIDGVRVCGIADAEVWTDVTSALPSSSGHDMAHAWADYDNDGDQDLYQVIMDQPNRLLRNNGDGSFTDVTSGPLGASGLSVLECSWGDYDNDGDDDLYLGIGGANQLLRNNGDGTFTDVTSGPLGITGGCSAAAWADHDRDGLLDLMIVRSADGNRILRNRGGGVFTERSLGTLRGEGCAWGDYDNDGDLDMLIANVPSMGGTGIDNYIYRNEGAGFFLPVGAGALENYARNYAAMWGDYDNDGDLDAYLGATWGHAEPAERRNPLIRNDDLTFRYVANDPMGENRSAWEGGMWGDYDLDGDLDLVQIGQFDGPDLFRNDGGDVFTSAKSGPLRPEMDNRDVSFVDYDGDGDLDLYFSSYADGCGRLFRNDLDFGRHYLKVELTGTVSQRRGIGARLTVVAGGIRQTRELTGGSIGQRNLRYGHFGLGETTTVDSLIVRWQSGLIQTLTDLAVDQTVQVVEPQAWSDVSIGALSSFDEAQEAAWVDFDRDGDPDFHVMGDFVQDKLLRNDAGVFVDATTSPFGFNLYGYYSSWGDYDNDGWPDAFLVSSSSVSLVRNLGGTFVDATHGELGDLSGYGTTWVDFDLDGDLDLYAPHYVTSRLFRNDVGDFTDQATGLLAGDNRGAVWGDYDGDLDQDVYILRNGTANTLLRNDAGVFVDVTAGPLGDTGNSYGAAWGDFDNDGDQDLYVVNPSTPNLLLRNDGEGVFTDVTDDLEGDLPGRQGAGNAIWCDLDNDGYLDLYLADSGRHTYLRNVRGIGFVDVSYELTSTASSYGKAAPADYDGDGDLDLLLVRTDLDVRLIRNDAYRGHHWLHLDLVGTTSNADAIGAQVHLYSSTGHQMREVPGGTGRGAQPSLTVEFGLGKSTAVDSLVVYWPSGQVQPIFNAPVDSRLTVTEGIVSDVPDAPEPEDYALHPCVPNPFNPVTTISYELPRAATVRLRVYDVAGRLVKTLVDGEKVEAGRRSAEWRGDDDTGRRMAAGLYFCRIDVDGYQQTRRMMLVK